MPTNRAMGDARDAAFVTAVRRNNVGQDVSQLLPIPGYFRFELALALELTPELTPTPTFSH